MALLENLLGTAISKVLKPDGISIGSTLSGALPSVGNITQGLAIPSAGAVVSAATSIFNAASTLQSQKQSAGNKVPNRKGYPNPLDEFASYTTLFTMACLKSEEVNDPYLYRNGSFTTDQVIFSSAGRYDQERVNSAYNTAYGPPEYFVDNIAMSSTVAPNQGTGSSNAHEYSFDVYEPYSVGLFLQSLQTAALYAGHPDYLSNCPFVLKMEFVGYKEDGSLYTGIQPKFFCIHLKKVDFTVNEAGSQYKVQAAPYNHGGFNSIIAQTFNDISLTGSTVKELLVTSERSLQQVLNDIEEKTVKSNTGKKSIADRFEIHFPETSNSPIPGVSDAGDTEARATDNVSNYNIRIKSASNSQNDTDFGDNPIGSASFGFKADSGGSYVSPRAQDVYDSATGVINRDQVTIDPKNRTFQFAQGQSLIAIISQAILSSDYAVDAIKKEPDSNGRVNWFRIDVQIQLLEYDTERNDYAKRIIYRVMPYKVHSSVFQSPDSVPMGYSDLAKEIVKQYDYIYTGQNNDILKFDIVLDTAFYTAISPTPPEEAGRSQDQNTQSGGEEERNAAKDSKGAAGVKAQVSATGAQKVRQDPDAIKLPFGGSGHLKPEHLVANMFQKAFLDNGQANLVNAKIEILGDPYWLVDNGIGGYLPGPGDTEQITEDGAANYEAGDIYVYVRFRSPIDMDEAGTYFWDEQSEFKDNPFSGIYKCIKLETKFSGGVFKQELDLVRMPLQASDFDSPVAPEYTPMYKVDTKVPESTGIIDDTEEESGDPDESDYGTVTYFA